MSDLNGTLLYIALMFINHSLSLRGLPYGNHAKHVLRQTVAIQRRAHGFNRATGSPRLLGGRLAMTVSRCHCEVCRMAITPNKYYGRPWQSSEGRRSAWLQSCCWIAAVIPLARNSFAMTDKEGSAN